jgi:hypothetical protein
MYLIMFAERVYGRLELVGVAYRAEVVVAERLVRLARVGEVRRP